MRPSDGERDTFRMLLSGDINMGLSRCRMISVVTRT